jgi:predicted Zn-dependent peptidase
MTQYKLKNGIRVILNPQKETKALTTLVLVGVGSRYESKPISGMAHFLEHMMFKGTPNRPTTLDLSRELDGIGADFNAYTAKDHTGYYIKSGSENIELSLDMLSDMIFNSKLEQVEIDRERGTIYEEINMYEDNPMASSQDLLEELIYSNNSLGWFEGGNKESLKNIDHQKMLTFKNKHYVPENIVISLAGNFETGEAKKLIAQYFDQKFDNKKKETFKKFISNQKTPQIKIKQKKTEQVHLGFGFLGPKYTDKDIFAFEVLSNILGGTMSSRLFINIRERHGLCYYIKSGLSVYQDTGNFVIRAGLDKKRIYEAIELILKELRNIKKDGVTAEELKRAKSNLKGRISLSLEDSSHLAGWYADQELLIGKSLTPEQKNRAIMNITAEDVKRVAQKTFKTEKINLAIIGPFKDETKFKKFLKI